MEEQTINSMVPIWRKKQKRTERQKTMRISIMRNITASTSRSSIFISVRMALLSTTRSCSSRKIFRSIIIRRNMRKGLELYSNGVLIMSKCGDLLPDYFSFVKGMVDSEDLSLNISREMLQHDRQLNLIAKNIKNKIKSALAKHAEGRAGEIREILQVLRPTAEIRCLQRLRHDIKTMLQDLLMFYSSKEKKLVTLDEYVSRMPEDQKYIYYATGESIERIDKLPQTELVKDKGYEILYFTEDIDEFAIKMLMKYKDKEFRIRLQRRSWASKRMQQDEPKRRKKRKQGTVRIHERGAGG